MRRISIFTIISLLCISSYIFAQTFYKPFQTNNDEYFKALIIFAQFEDDTASNYRWPPGKLPRWAENFTSEETGTFSLSEYYRVMSSGRFKFIADYYDSLVFIPGREKFPGRGYRNANLAVLKKVDKNIDFREYDNWFYNSENGLHKFNRDSSDSVVDMLIIIYRNISTAWFGNFTAIASIGSDILTDDGVKIKGGFGISSSGITVRKGFQSPEQMLNCLVHEYGHYIYGAGHSDYGGVMTGVPYPGVFATLRLNSWERERAGYINFLSLPDDGGEIELMDYVTSGDALKIPVAGDNIYYVLENHQFVSPFEDFNKKALPNNRNSGGKGLYIYLFSSAERYPYKAALKSAGGGWDWGITDTVKNSPLCGCDVPLLGKIKINSISGLGESAASARFKGNIWPNWYVADKKSGEPLLTEVCMGSLFDAFAPGYNEIFSPWSNPSSVVPGYENVSITVQIIEMSGGKIKLKVFRNEESAVKLPPSKPHISGFKREEKENALFWHSNNEPDIKEYFIYRSEHESYNLVLFGKTGHIKESGTQKFSGDFIPGFYYSVRAVDEDGLKSVLSESVYFK